MAAHVLQQGQVHAVVTRWRRLTRWHARVRSALLLAGSVREPFAPALLEGKGRFR